MFMSNARIIANLCMSDLFDRFPGLQVASAESGLGWIPFLLETLEYQLAENAAGQHYSLTPAEYFARNVYSCFWFERKNIADSVRQVGVDNVMFETDFPHPTCLYPAPLQHAASGLAALDLASRKKILSENAAKVYAIPLI